MPRFLLTPRWIAVHVAFMSAIAFCLVAGWWQFGVYQDSQARHEDRDRPAVPVSDVVQSGEDIADAADRPVNADGRYLTEHTLIVPGRIHDGVLGWFVLAPLETSEGMVIPVLRGWIEEPGALDTLPEQPVSTIGHLVLPETPEHATVRTGQELDPNEIAYIAPHTIADATGIPESVMLDGYLLLTSSEPEPDDVALVDLNEVAPVRDVSPWQNLSYWAQWWVFAIAAVVFWGSAVRAGVRSRRQPDIGTDTSGSTDLLVRRDSPGNRDAKERPDGVNGDSEAGEPRVNERAAPPAQP
ncbi:SURF1 family protein [Phytoactinopolyspora halotolerans]|uniref:SURF1-like protein n=1 Tax=Phytoactinopolyspora halotolerans TaxID=1981512 RepID=A0A6L9SG29_9ACTN|nr:SURF1 family protein [Phytoactinopolyspora halotolerans]NEE04236.1 SURF1 family protein [Phytoactinopolyspora halotolerans]